MRLVVNEDEVEPFLALMRKRLGNDGGLTITLTMNRDNAERILREAKPNQRLDLVWCDSL